MRNYFAIDRGDIDTTAMRMEDAPRSEVFGAIWQLAHAAAEGLLGSDTNFAVVQALHPTGEPKASRIWALTPITHA